MLCLLALGGCRLQHGVGEAAPAVDPGAIRIIVPVNFLTGEPWRLDLGPPGDVSASLERRVSLEAGSYSVLDLFGQVQRQTGRRFVWHGKEEPDLASEDAMQRKVLGVGEARGERIIVRWKAGKRRLSAILDETLAYMTENGVGLESPHSEVWVALVSTHAVHLVLLPTPEVDDPLTEGKPVQP